MGRLPALHRLLIVGLILLLCLLSGVWLAASRDLPLGGFGIGLAGGSVLAFLLVHDFRRTRPPV